MESQAKIEPFDENVRTYTFEEACEEEGIYSVFQNGRIPEGHKTLLVFRKSNEVPPLFIDETSKSCVVKAINPKHSFVKSRVSVTLTFKN